MFAEIVPSVVSPASNAALQIAALLFPVWSLILVNGCMHDAIGSVYQACVLFAPIPSL